MTTRTIKRMGPLVAVALLMTMLLAADAFGQSDETHQITDANGATFEVAAPFTVDTLAPPAPTTTTTTAAPPDGPLPSGHYPIAEPGFGQIRAFDYPQAALDACDPAANYQPTVGDELRIEVDVLIEGRPSEHWTLRWQIGEFRGFNRDGTANLQYDHAVLIRHQNAGPGFNTPANQFKMEPLQWNERLQKAGPTVIDFEVVGDETGLAFHTQCVFETLEAPVG